MKNTNKDILTDISNSFLGDFNMQIRTLLIEKFNEVLNKVMPTSKDFKLELFVDESDFKNVIAIASQYFYNTVPTSLINQLFDLETRHN